MTACLCKNRPQCIWCGEDFESHGQLIIHAKIDDKGNASCLQNPYSYLRKKNYQGNMRKKSWK